MMHPQSIAIFDRLFLGALALALLNSVLFYKTILAELNTDPAMAESGLGMVFLVAMMTFSFGISLLLWFFISRKASKISKWILVIFTLLGAAMLPATLPNTDMLEAALTLVITALQLAAIFFLFRSDARAWFDSRGGKHMDPSVFE